MDEVCITFPESDVIVLSLELLCKSLVHTVNIGERPLLRLSNVAFLCPMRLSCEMGSTEDRPNLAWGFCFRSLVLRPSPPIVDVILEVFAADELLSLILEGDTVLSGVIDILMEPKVFILVPLGAISTQWVRPLKYPNFLHSNKDILP